MASDDAPAGGSNHKGLLIALIILAVVIVIVVVARMIMTGLTLRFLGGAVKTLDKGSFWTPHGGGVPPDGQARRVDAAAKGTPDKAWAEAYWPPHPPTARR